MAPPPTVAMGLASSASLPGSASSTLFVTAACTPATLDAASLEQCYSRLFLVTRCSDPRAGARERCMATFWHTTKYMQLSHRALALAAIWHQCSKWHA
jgi:hypothetical protein